MVLIVEDPYKLQKLAREEMKAKILADVLSDLMICKMEGWDHTEYINGLKNLIDSLMVPRMKKKRKPKLTKAEKELNESHMSTGEGKSALMAKWKK